MNLALDLSDRLRWMTRWEVQEVKLVMEDFYDQHRRQIPLHKWRQIVDGLVVGSIEDLADHIYWEVHTFPHTELHPGHVNHVLANKATALVTAILTVIALSGVSAVPSPSDIYHPPPSISQVIMPGQPGFVGPWYGVPARPGVVTPAPVIRPAAPPPPAVTQPARPTTPAPAPAPARPAPVAPAPAPVKPAPVAPKPAPAPVVTTTAGQRAVNYALEQVGEPYEYGGTGPSSWDCSGLTYMAWNYAGYQIPRTAYSQWVGLRHVSLSSLHIGDIIVYNGGGHVALYIGNGKVVEAPHAGAYVQIVSMYYPGSVSGAVRP